MSAQLLLTVWPRLVVLRISAPCHPILRDVNSVLLRCIAVSEVIFDLCTWCDRDQFQIAKVRNYLILAGSGARAGVAIQILIENGFEGQLYNGQGVNQWQAAGFPLVDDSSIVPPCSTSEAESCAGSRSPSEAPSMSPSDAPVLVLPIRKVPRTTNKETLKIKRSSPGTDFVETNGIRGGGGRRQLSSSYYPQELPPSS